MIGLKHCLLNL